MKLGYNKFGLQKNTLIANKFLGQIGHFSTQINPIITNPGYKKTKMGGPELSLTVFQHFYITNAKSVQKCDKKTLPKNIFFQSVVGKHTKHIKQKYIVLDRGSQTFILAIHIANKV